MLTYLGIWIENLVVIVLLTSLVELLLPKSELEKYTRVVLGLFVLIAILNPILNLFNTDYNLHQLTDLLNVSSEQSEQAPKMSQIMEQGKALRATNQTKAKQNYRKQVAKQISALLAFDEDLPSTSVDVRLKTNHQIDKILITIKNKKEDNFSKRIKPVKVNKINIKEESKDRLNSKDSSSLVVSEEIKRRLANFYGLNIEQVIVQAE